MVETLRTLRRRIRSIENVRQITRAMEMVSSAKLRRTLKILQAGRPYASKLQELLARLAESESALAHPLFEARGEAGRITLVVFTSDRGLCGAFNANLVNAAERFAVERGRERTEMYCVGRKGAAHCAKRGWAVCGTMTEFSGNIDLERSNRLANEMKERFLSRQTDEVDLVYSEFISTARIRPKVARFLSLEREALLAGSEAAEANRRVALDYIFEPSTEEVFDSLLPRYLQARMYITFAEQFTSEHTARMLAMHNATENCEELKDSMTLRLNKARQASITKELLDIVGGAEALRG
ncbi:MAG: ATP synthase F1 subunit gamma [Candidatus Sumerlaeota bacterium]|nr:ATP synthase F1 subunit gamma [Candidatus Sumerlaeota bacterium]